MTDKEFLGLLIKSQDKIIEEIGNIKEVQARQEVHLEEHIRRTELNEKAVEELKNALQPVQKHVSQVETTLKIIGGAFSAITLIGGAILAIIQLIKAI